jgi:methionyl-tRNA formyltransferase
MMGTGEFALPAFVSLYETTHQVVGLFTQPDRQGRGHHHHPHPMKEAALARGTPVFQPEKVNTPEGLEVLRSLKPDVCLVAAYGQILSKNLLEIPRLGAFNLHASLLPKYRGAAPIQYAIWKGETETGITMFRIEPSLDAGPIVGMEKMAIGEQETHGELETRLADLAPPLVLRVINQLVEDRLPEEPQNNLQATKAPRLKKTDGEIHWDQSAREIGWHIRAMQPWPSPYTFFHQLGSQPVRLIVTKAQALPDEQLPSEDPAHHDLPLGKAPPGTVVFTDNHRLLVQTGEGVLDILELRPEGKRNMPAGDFLHGHSVRPGDRMGPEPFQDSL